ncbi:MAG: hypothetical protein IJV16_07320 [Lachnospiraceae bacterium]|nr:hypothetical protein [Lachnospiraceae bacterium]
MKNNNKKHVKPYSAATLKKAVKLLKTLIAYYAACIASGEILKACISSGNKKIGRVLNVSIAPVITCGNCSGCKEFCYDIKAVIQYPEVSRARARNTALAIHKRDEFFRQIDEKMTHRKKNKFFRWHVSGDIMDYDYFCRMVEIAKNHPDFVIWTYTKMYGIVNMYVRNHGGDKSCIPENFSIMFSEWRGMPMNNPYKFPEFRVKFEDDSADMFSGLWKCPWNCDACKACNHGCIVGESVYCDVH